MFNSNDKLQEMQLLEQNMQNLSMQKQAFQMEFSETESALKEINSSGDEVFKIIGQIMLKTHKQKIIDELSNKKKFLDLKIKNLENQEKSFAEKADLLREEILKSNEKNQKK